MNNEILKYQLCLTGVTELNLPHNAEILSVNQQKEELFLWAEVDQSNPLPLEKRIFVSIMTGEIFSENVNKKYIGTVLLNSGSFVVHVFEITKERTDK